LQQGSWALKKKKTIAAAPPEKKVSCAGSGDREARDSLLCQRGGVVWLTGLSGSGKSTLARRLEQRLVAAGHQAYVLDGDIVRRGLNSDLGFSPEDRDENIRRIGEVAALFADAGVIVITAFISPYRSARARARAAAPAGGFIEVLLDIPIQECERRDPKGLYRRARGGEIGDFTGIGAPYEPPEKAELVLKTAELTVDECVERIWRCLDAHSFFQKESAAR
jgi:adenylyl-sulfate kinase